MVFMRSRALYVFVLLALSSTLFFTVDLSSGYASAQQDDPAKIAATNGIEIANGRMFSCAIWPDGTLKCWGNNLYGQVGDGTTQNVRYSPVAVDLGSSIPADSK